MEKRTAQAAMEIWEVRADTVIREVQVDMEIQVVVDTEKRVVAAMGIREVQAGTVIQEVVDMEMQGAVEVDMEVKVEEEMVIAIMGEVGRGEVGAIGIKSEYIQGEVVAREAERDQDLGAIMALAPGRVEERELVLDIPDIDQVVRDLAGAEAEVELVLDMDSGRIQGQAINMDLDREEVLGLDLQDIQVDLRAVIIGKDHIRMDMDREVMGEIDGRVDIIPVVISRATVISKEILVDQGLAGGARDLGRMCGMLLLM